MERAGTLAEEDESIPGPRVPRRHSLCPRRWRGRGTTTTTRPIIDEEKQGMGRSEAEEDVDRG
jgi:anti-sigma factor ChrR (cupin superfamily)